MNNNDKDIKIGDFFVKNGLITEEQLIEALDLQKDNKDRLIGEILVTLGFVSKEKLVMSIEMFLISTDRAVKYADEWLDQDEIDMLLEKLNEKTT